MMLPRFKQWMESPVFPGGEEKTRLAAILDKILMTAWVAQFFGIFIYPGDISTRFVLILIFAITAFSLQVLLRKGHFVRVNMAFLSLFWLFTTTVVYLDGGKVTSPFILTYAILVLWTAISLNIRSTILILAACLASGQVMVVTTPTPNGNEFLSGSTSPMMVWGMQSFVLIFLAVIVGVVSHYQRTSSRQVYNELVERLIVEKELVRFKKLADRARDIFLIVDSQTGHILYGNRAAESLYGYNSAELASLNIGDLRPKENHYNLQEQLNQVAMGGLLFETCHIRKDGTIFPVEVSSARFDLNNENLIISVIRDISERKHAEAELNKQYEFTSMVLETVGSLVVVMDPAGVITLWNRACVDLTGYTAVEAIGRPIWDFMLPGDETNHARQDFGRRITDHFPFHFENQWVSCSGEVRLIEWNNNFILDPDGQVRFIIDTGQDVTHKKQMEMALADSEKLFRSMFEQAALGILIADPHAKLLDFNQRLCDMFGYSREELLGHNINDFGYPEDIEENQLDARKLLLGAEKQSIWEKRYICKDGAILWTLSGVTLLRDEHGQPELFIAIMEDITDRKRAETELTRLNAELEGRVKQRTTELEMINKELEAFNYSVSHDLRAPLRSMLGYAQALWEDYASILPEEGRGFIHRIEISAERMEELINDLLKFSRLGRKPVERIKIFPSKIAALVWEELKDEIGDRSIQFKIEKIPACKADPVLLKQVYTNLISNAIKYTRPRSVAKISVGSSLQEGEVVMWVKDNGVGFDMQYADKLFGIFQRLHSEKQFEGMGVGLAIVQRIIHRHNGRIWADAAQDAGATFFFTLNSKE
jgi:PAS domain S-box-containing protein